MSLTKQDLAAIDKLIKENIHSNNDNLRTGWRDNIKEAIQKSQEEIISRLMSVLVHFPTRDEVKQMIDESTTILAIKQDVNELKDQLAEFRDAFTQSRLKRLELRMDAQPGYLASPK